MKKYLMMGAAALLVGASFTSCSKDKDLYDPQANAMKFLQDYQAAFVQVFGDVNAYQSWGFGSASQARMTRSGNTNMEGYEEYWYTHGYFNADGNLIASANMNHNQWGSTDLQSMPGGGWVVPDPLTEGQKERVQLYFQANPNLSYVDPHYAHFFVQQVYTGGTSAPTTGNKEVTVGADNQGHKGMTLNQLTVGQACSHINDFNAGTCTASNVLNHEGVIQSDQITLMLNVDDTSCFGYHETSGSNTGANNNHNDKMALVDAATIDAWAAANGNPGEAVVDKWNRSFMGFDYELLPESEIVLDSYAKLSNWDGNLPEYAWDGTDVMVIGSAPEATQAEEVDITSTFALDTRLNNVTCEYDNNGNIVCNFTGQYYNSIQFYQNADWTSYDKLVIEFANPSPINATIDSNNGSVQINVGDIEVEVPTPNYVYNNNGGPTISNSGIGTTPLTLTIKSVKLVKEATTPDSSIKYYTSEYLLAGGTDQISFYSTNTNMYGGIVKNVSADDMKTTVDGKTCINLKWIKEELLDQGYHPISTDLKKWVKWQAACDGYYSDWIVTLTKAQRIGEVPEQPVTKQIRVMAEDVAATAGSDIDFNDVVFDVKATFPVGATSVDEVTITVHAAGGTIPLYIGTPSTPKINEVHAKLGVTDTRTMINTNAQPYADNVNWFAVDGKAPQTFTLATTVRKDYFLEDVRDYVVVTVTNEGSDITVTATQGQAAGKIAVPVGTPWAKEKVNMADVFGQFKTWVNTAAPANWYESYDPDKVAK